MDVLPGKLFGNEVAEIQVFNYDLEKLMNRSKVVLEKYAISFIIRGHKQINFANAVTYIDCNSALLISRGNYLMTEQCSGSEDYRSILLFFSKNKLSELLNKKHLLPAVGTKQTEAPFFTFEQDEFIKLFVQSLSLQFALDKKVSEELLEVKFEEIMIYLADKYGHDFLSFLQGSLQTEENLSFKKTVEANKFTNLTLGEIAFLCNMSLSTFKRRFSEVFKSTPGNWFKQKRMERAKALLQSGEAKPSDIFTLSGYKNLSHFSAAYKSRFGKSPRHHLAD
jgi:AraC-like DNA-binding protein